MGYWKTVDYGDGYDKFSDEQVYVDDSGRETRRTRQSRKAYERRQERQKRRERGQRY